MVACGAVHKGRALATIEDLKHVLHNKAPRMSLNVRGERDDAEALFAAVGAVAHRARLDSESD